MARVGLFLLCCAGLLGVVSVAAGEDAGKKLMVTLEVQSALEQGRAHLVRSDFASAVACLESQIARIDGNREYLTVLRDAYRGHVKSLRLAGRAAEAEIYARRLKILDPTAETPAPAQPVTPVSTATLPPQPLEVKTPTTSDIKARGKIETSPALKDPFHESNHKRAIEARVTLEQAEQAFRDKLYNKAGPLYEQTARTAPEVMREAQERWAYCKLFCVVEQLNQCPKIETLDALEQEVRTAMSLAPKLNDFGNNVLGTITTRRNGPSTTAQVKVAETPPAQVRHAQQSGSAWAVAETNNFRVFHNQTRDFAEKVIEVAETTRVAMTRKWFGLQAEDWNPRCDIYLYADVQAYSRETGVPQNSPGHSTISNEGSRVISRRIDLHIDEAKMLAVTLPHETTHVVLAGRFGPHLVPRWADEGMAVLSEPRDSIDRHLVNLPRHRDAQQLLSVRQLMLLEDYPKPHFIGAFYAQSVSLVEFLTLQKGPQTFAKFLHDALKTNYEAALKQHYGYQGYADLEANWKAHAFKVGSYASKKER